MGLEGIVSSLDILDKNISEDVYEALVISYFLTLTDIPLDYRFFFGHGKEQILRAHDREVGAGSSAFVLFGIRRVREASLMIRGSPESWVEICKTGTLSC